MSNTSNFPGQIHETPGGGIVLSKLDDVINWARSNSLWPLTFATSCCGIEYMAVAGAKYDFSRFGFLNFLYKFSLPLIFAFLLFHKKKLFLLIFYFFCDGFQVCIKNVRDLINVRARIEIIANIKLL